MPVQLLDAKGVAVILGVDHRTVQRYFLNGEIQACRIGPKLWRTTREAIDLYIASRMELSQARPVIIFPASGRLRHRQ